MAKVTATLFVIFLTAFIQVSKCDDNNKLEFAIQMTGCHRKEGVPMEVAQQYLSLDLDFKGFEELVENNPDLRCFTSCMYEFLNIMDGCSINMGKEIKEIIPETADADTIYDQFKVCTENITGTDRCECAYQVERCVKELQDKEKENAKK